MTEPLPSTSNGGRIDEEAKRAKARERKARSRAKRSEEKKDEDRAKNREIKKTDGARERDRNRKAKFRENLQEDEAAEIRERDRIRKAQFRQNLQEDETAEVRERARNRMAQFRENLKEDETAEIRERDRLRKQLQRKLNETKVKPKDGLRSVEILNGTFNVPLLEDSKDAIGKMDVRCEYCGAFKFKKESAGFCCSNGKVLPKVFPRPPEQLMKLWTGQGRIDRLFRSHTRELNNALCLSSIQVNEKKFGNFTPSVIFQGQLKHYAGALLPNDGCTPRFAQLYCMDPALETSQRFSNMYLHPNTSKSQKGELKELLNMRK